MSALKCCHSSVTLTFFSTSMWRVPPPPQRNEKRLWKCKTLNFDSWTDCYSRLGFPPSPAFHPSSLEVPYLYRYTFMAMFSTRGDTYIHTNARTHTHTPTWSWSITNFARKKKYLNETDVSKHNIPYESCSIFFFFTNQFSRHHFLTLFLLNLIWL